ncbi:Eco29kI family restriction endonuclease [Ferrovibrio sp.]|uniref:Eco29kI family restriction endonuclease n=1 Tax=Ferrovibrio sp. TaxID=1917215 RepID=UPI00311E6DDD
MSAEVKKHFTAALKQVQGAIAALDGEDVSKALKCALKADEETAKALNLLAATEASTDFLRAAILRANTSTALSASLARSVDLSSTSASNLRPRLKTLAENLSGLKDAVGPLKAPLFVFDPAGFDVIAHVAATALLAQPARALTERPSEWGAGIYALFYRGGLDFYGPLSTSDTPIYVGSAAPSEHSATTPEEQGGSLVSRIMEHRSSIEEVQSHAGGNLRVEDFQYRYLVVKSGWELAAEQYLIRYFRPLWNKETKVCTGIGKHGDASSTRGNTRSMWDTVHPGRPWTLTPDTKPNKKSPEELIAGIRAHFVQHPPRKLDITDILPLGETHPGIGLDEGPAAAGASDDEDDDE